MFDEVFPFLIQHFSRIVNFVFNLPIDKKYNITLGMFLLTCAFIGIVIYFIFGSDFFPGHIGLGSRSNNSNYQPKHAPGNTRTYDSNYSTRVGRHK